MSIFILPNKWLCKKLRANITYLMLTTSTGNQYLEHFGRKLGGWGCGSQNGPLTGVHKQKLLQIGLEICETRNKALIDCSWSLKMFSLSSAFASEASMYTCQDSYAPIATWSCIEEYLLRYLNLKSTGSIVIYSIYNKYAVTTFYIQLHVISGRLCFSDEKPWNIYVVYGIMAKHKLKYMYAIYQRWHHI